MPIVEVPGLGEVEFPDDTPQDVMERAIQQRLAPPPPAGKVDVSFAGSAAPRPQFELQGTSGSTTRPSSTVQSPYEALIQTLRLPAQGLDELVGQVYDREPAQPLRFDSRTGAAAPGGTHPGAAGRALKAAQVLSPLRLPEHLARGAEAIGIPGAGFARGALEEGMETVSTLATDPSNALIPASRAAALVFLPQVAEDLGVSAADLSLALEKNGWKLTPELGKKLARTATGVLFAGLLTGSAAKGGLPRVPEIGAPPPSRTAVGTPPPDITPSSTPIADIVARVEEPARVEPMDDYSFLPEPARQPFAVDLARRIEAYEADPQLPLAAAADAFAAELPARYAEKVRERFLQRAYSRAQGQDFLTTLIERTEGRAPESSWADPESGASVEVHGRDPRRGGVFILRDQAGRVIAAGESANGGIAAVVGGSKIMGLPDLPNGRSSAGPIYRAMKALGLRSSNTLTPAGMAAQLRAAERGLDVGGGLADIGVRERSQRPAAQPTAGAAPSAGAGPEVGAGGAPLQPGRGPVRAGDEGSASGVPGFEDPLRVAARLADEVPGWENLSPEEQAALVESEAQGPAKAPVQGPPGPVGAPPPGGPALSPEAGVLRLSTPPDFPTWYSQRYGRSTTPPPPASPIPATHLEALHQLETTGGLFDGEGVVQLPVLGQELTAALQTGAGDVAAVSSALRAAHPALDPQAILPALQELGLVRLREVEGPQVLRAPDSPLPPPGPDLLVRPADPGAAALVAEAFGDDSPQARAAAEPRVYAGVELTARGQDPAAWTPRAVSRGTGAAPAPQALTPRGFDKLDAARAEAARGDSLLERFKEWIAPASLRTKFYDKFTPINDLAAMVQDELVQRSPDSLVDRPNAPRYRLPGWAEARINLSELAAATPGRVEVMLHRVQELARRAESLNLSVPVERLADLYGWLRAIKVVEGRAETLREQTRLHARAMWNRRKIAGAERLTQRRRREVDTDAKIRSAIAAGDHALARQLRDAQAVRYERSLRGGFITPEKRAALVKRFRRQGQVLKHRDALRGAETRLGEQYYESRRDRVPPAGSAAESLPPERPPFPSDRAPDPTFLAALRGKFTEAKQELQGLEKRLGQGKIVPLDYTRADVEAAIGQIRGVLTPDQWAQSSRIVDELFAFNQEILDLYKQEGLISERIYDELVARGDHYIPLTRIRADLAAERWGVSNLLSLPMRRYLQRFEGSELATIRPFEASALAAARAVSDIARNQAARVIVALHELAPEVTRFKKLRADDPVPENAGLVTFWKDGEKQRWVVPEDIAVVQAAAKDPGVAGMAMRLSQSALRFGTTGGNIAFMVGNVPRDLHETVALLKTRKEIPYGLRTATAVGAYLDALFRDVIPRSDTYWEALWEGALTTRQRSLTPETFVLTGEGKGFGERLLRVLSYLPNVTEEAGKVATYKRLRAEGTSRKLAAYETREFSGTPNASRRGAYSDDANALVMFLNINIQGKARMWRRLRDEPGRVIRPLALSALVTSAVLLKYNAQYLDEEGRLEYEHVPSSDKRDYHIFFYPDSARALGVSPIDPATGRRKYLRVRKGDTQQIFHNIAERVLWATLKGQEPKILQTAVDTAAQAVIPGATQIDVRKPGESTVLSLVSQLNPIIRTPVEQLANRNLFQDTPIETRAEQGMSPDLRYSQRTSPTAVVLGQLTGISPKRLEHVARSSFGGLTEEVLSIIDPAFQPLSPQTRAARPGLERIPFLSSIYKRVVGGRRDQVREDLADLVYGRQEELTTIVKGDIPHLLKANPQELQTYLRRHGIGGVQELGMLQEESKKLDEVGRALNELYGRLRSAKTDEEALAANRQIMRVLREGKRLIEMSEKIRSAARKAGAVTFRPEPPPSGGPVGAPPPALP